VSTLNAVERRALATATLLVAVGTVVRLAAGPDPARTAWRPGAIGAGGSPTVDDVRGAVEAGVAREARAARPLAPGERLDPNFADATELRRLPGIGPAKAEAIVRDRRERGPFGSLDALGRVPGIGPATLERLAPHLALRPAPAAPPGARPSSSPIDLNRADPAELARLPGIGPVLARRIVEERERRGGFRRLEDLLEVPGVGPATLEKVRTGLRVR
jgi:competence protein ComEA